MKKYWGFEKALICFASVFLAIGLAVVIAAAVMTADRAQKLNSFVHVHATVIDYKVTEHRDSDGTRRKSYAEIAAFTVDGVEYTVTNSLSTNTGFVQIGGRVEIAYNPDDPNDCVFITASNSGLYVFLFALGGVFVAVSVAIIVYACRSMAKVRN